MGSDTIFASHHRKARKKWGQIKVIELCRAAFRAA
jgi:hypothetical protein